MSTKAKTKTTPTKVTPALPPGCEASMTRAQICHAAQMSIRSFQKKLSAGDFPRADWHLGDRPRWLVATYNRWTRQQCGITEEG